MKFILLVVAIVLFIIAGICAIWINEVDLGTSIGIAFFGLAAWAGSTVSPQDAPG